MIEIFQKFDVLLNLVSVVLLLKIAFEGGQMVSALKSLGKMVKDHEIRLRAMERAEL